MSIYQAANPLFGFGQHPKFVFSRERYIRTERKKGRLAHLQAHEGRPIRLRELEDSRHPSVTLIPRDQFLSVIDEFDDPTGFERNPIHFSSHDMYINRDNDWVFDALQQAPFWRLGDIPQLGYLSAAEPDVATSLGSLFVHTRWIHSLLSAGFAEVILARNGFPEKQRAPIVLAVGCHDIATPIGGDAIKMIDPQLLDEEMNFAWVLRRHKHDRLWEQQFGFHVDVAAHWVKNNGVIGRLLDVVDKFSYVMLDCYHIGIAQNGRVRKFGIEHPLFMDVWNDLVFSSDKQNFGFLNPERLYHFLFARALEHVELLHNPRSRLVDFCVANLVRPLYKKGEITKEDLLTMGKEEFYNRLAQYYPARRLSPEFIDFGSMDFRRFNNQEEADAFAANLPKVFHREFFKGFNPCLDWPIANDSECRRTKLLRDCLSSAQIQALESLVEEVRGYVVYWRTSPSE
jgi:hypothetical protein